MDEDKPVPVVNIPPVRIIAGPSKQGIIGNIKGEWDEDRSVAVVKDIGVPVEEALADIGMNTRRAVINLKCDCEE